ncbi:class I SAM-dependent methyltransferase [Nonomuraea jabiensis]|uniref:class I SAM-dependent methyltransferase n=1 Tax=Nonomuraea jabiensis TaxID=882448 RepID=UPI003D7432C5
MPVELPSRDDLRLVRRTLEALPGVAEAEVLLIADGPGVATSALVSGGHPPPEPSAVAPPQARLGGGGTTMVPGCLAAMDRAAVLAIAQTLHTTGWFRDSAEEVADALGAAPRHRWIVRRWLAALTSENLPAPPSRQELARAMRDLDAARQELGYPAEMGRFFQTALRSLPRLVRDEISLQSLLFAGGGMTTARGNYRDNLISRHLNRAAAGAVAARAPARMLEIGAGVGATTDAVLAAVGEVDYLFTDVSAFFLDAARERFAHRPGLRYALLDVNAPMALDEQPFDVVLAANVLHNARHAGRTLAAIRELLSPGGTLVLIESCVEHHLVSASMHFLMSPRADALLPGFADVRQGQDRVFLGRTEWIRQLTAAGYRDVRVEPAPDDPLAAAGQYVFTAVRGDRHPDPAPLLSKAAEALPPHLVPREIHIVDALITDRSHRP